MCVRRIASYVKLVFPLLFTLISQSISFSQTTVLSRGELLPQMDALASSADTPSNRAQYISALMTLAGGNTIHSTFRTPLSKRLAIDEERVRNRRQEPVSETSISMAFNRMALLVQSPVHVDAETVHQLRESLSSQAPRLITVKSQSSSCNPGEAIFLLYVLAANNGSITRKQADISVNQLPSLHSSVSTEDSTKRITFLISHFATEHSQVELLRKVEEVLSLLHL